MARKEPKYRRYFCDPAARLGQPGGQDTRGASSTARETLRALLLDKKTPKEDPRGEASRGDTIKPLRKALGRIRTKSWAKEEGYGIWPTSRDQKATSLWTVGFYRNVHIVGFTFCNRGLAARLQFSLARTGKRIHWEQSKRLLTGSLIALTLEDDNFRSQCTMAIVAARPLANLVQDLPEIDIFFPRPEEVQIDPGQSWIMVEEKGR